MRVCMQRARIILRLASAPAHCKWRLQCAPMHCVAGNTRASALSRTPASACPTESRVVFVSPRRRAALRHGTSLQPHVVVVVVARTANSGIAGRGLQEAAAIVASADNGQRTACRMPLHVLHGEIVCAACYGVRRAAQSKPSTVCGRPRTCWHAHPASAIRRPEKQLPQ